MEKNGNSADKSATLLDRFAVGGFSAVLALAFGLLLLFGLGANGLVLPFRYVWWFTAAMFSAGFLLLENPILAALSLCWQALRVLSSSR